MEEVEGDASSSGEAYRPQEPTREEVRLRKALSAEDDPGARPVAQTGTEEGRTNGEGEGATTVPASEDGIQEAGEGTSG